VSKTKKFVLAVLSLVLIAGLSGGGFAYKAHADEQARERAARERVERAYQNALRNWRADMATWDDKNSSYQACERATRDAFKAGDALDGQIQAGGSRDDYTSAADDLATAINTATRQTGTEFDCLSVIAKLETANSEAIKATNIWLDWINGDYAYVTEVNDLPGMNRHFRKAADALSDANVALVGMQPGDKPSKPLRGERYNVPSADDTDGDNTPDSTDAHDYDANRS
jgi:hypothetical protein